MTDTMLPSPATAVYPGLLARAWGVLTAPRATYAAIAERPRALGILLLALAISVGASFAFLSTSVGQEALLDQQYQMLDRFESAGMRMPPQAYDQIEASVGRAKYFGAVFQTIAGVVVTAVIAGLVLVVFNFGLGGNATYRQLFAVTAHSGVVLAVQALFVTPLNYMKGSLSGSTNLGVFTPFLSDTSMAARFLGVIDLFFVWWAVSLAIGVGVVYRKRTGPIAWSFLAVYAGLALLYAVATSLFFGA